MNAPDEAFKIVDSHSAHKHLWAEAHKNTLLIIGISRQEVESGNHAVLLDNLLELSQSKELTEQYANRLALMFGGYDDDPRPLAEIPEVVSFLCHLTSQWPYWAHFVEKDFSGTVGVILALLAKGMGSSFAVPQGQSVSPGSLDEIIRAQVQGICGLQLMHGLAEEGTQERVAHFMRAVEVAVGTRH